MLFFVVSYSFSNYCIEHLFFLLLDTSLFQSFFIHPCTMSWSFYHTRVIAYIDSSSLFADLFPGSPHTIPVLEHLLFYWSSCNGLLHPESLIWILSQWPHPAKEMMCWVSHVSSIQVLYFENIESWLPGFTSLAFYARTHIHTRTHTHTHKSAHKSAHMHAYIHKHANKDTLARACVRGRESVCICAWVRFFEGVRVTVCVKVSVRVCAYLSLFL